MPSWPGVRAYNTRTRLRLAHEKLMRWVENGGTMVVQYNTVDLVLPVIGPRPFEISRDRVTVEEAPVRFVDAADPLLTTPNRIGATDFDGWVQERGLYFAGKWDPAYRTVLAANDPGESETVGGQLAIRHGKGCSSTPATPGGGSCRRASSARSALRQSGFGGVTAAPWAIGRSRQREAAWTTDERSLRGRSDPVD